MILPPGERLAEVARDEETNFSWRKAVVSQLFVVIDIGDDGLSRTPRIGVYEAAYLLR